MVDYFWNTDPESSFSSPLPNTRISRGFLQVDFLMQGLPPFSQVHAETSTDLRNWTLQRVESIPSGFRCPTGRPQAIPAPFIQPDPPLMRALGTLTLDLPLVKWHANC